MISILSVFPPFRGGIANFSDYLYRHLQKHAEVEAFNYSYLYPSFLFPGKSQFINGEGSTYAKPLINSCNPFSWKKAAHRILNSNSEQVIICYWHPFFAPALLRISSLLKKENPGITVTVLAHNVIPHEYFPLGKSLSKRLLNQADKVLLLSKKSYNEAQGLGIHSEIITLFHPVYEQDKSELAKTQLREKYGFRDDEHVLLFFGLIRNYKGLDILIDALNNIDIHKLNIRPFIVGEFYSDKSALLSRIKPHHLKSYHILDRFVSDKEMAEVFTLSDVLVMPYRSATQSGILANAINFYLPSIVSDLQGLTEHVEHQKTAWIFENENSEDLRNAIISLTDNKIRERISAAMVPLKEELSWNEFTQRLIKGIGK